MEADQRLSRISLEQFNLYEAFGPSWLNATQPGIGREELLAKRRDNKHSPLASLFHISPSEIFFVCTANLRSIHSLAELLKDEFFFDNILLDEP